MSKLKKFLTGMLINYNIFRKISISLTLLLSITLISNGQDVLTSWDFAGNGGDETTVTAGTYATNISTTSPSGVISRGAGLNPATNSSRFNANQWITTTGDNSNLSYAVTNNKYMEWAIAPVSGYQLNLDSVVFNWQRSGTGPDTVTLRSSQDSYTANLGTLIFPSNSAEGVKIVLTGFINLQSTITFRLFGYGATGTTGSGGFEGTGDDLIVYGNVVAIQDADSEVNAPVSQVTGGSISSLATTSGSAVDVFRFSIEDLGTTDGKDTKITNIRVTPGASNTIDWTDHIQGVTLSDGSPITIGTVDIQDTYIDIPITAGDLDITDNTSSEVTLAIYLNTSNIVDKAILSFLIDASAHGFTADNSGSLFIDTFPGGDISSNNFTMGVVGTEMQFLQSPSDVLINDVMSPAVTVAFTDVNGNIDLDFHTEEINISGNTVTLIGDPVNAEVMSDGIATFSTLSFSSSGTGTLTAVDATSGQGIPDETSSSFDVIPVLSTIQAVASSESSGVSSLANDASITLVTEGVQVWQMDLFDGDGTNPDNDGLDTDYTSIRLDQHVANEISNWQSAILAVGFFEGSTHIPGIATINQTNISFIPTNPISVPDGGAVGGSKKTISVHISLQTTLPTGLDGESFVFEVSEGGVTVDVAGSQLGTFTVSSNVTSNAIDVTGTKLFFVQQPTNVIQDQTMAPPVTVGFADANDNIDINFETEEIDITSSVVTLNDSPVLGDVLADGLAYFSTLSFSTSGTGTLTASDANDILGTSETLISSSFDVIAIADHLTFVSVPTSGQVNQTISSFTVEARRPDQSVDTNYTGDITISLNSGTGSISGTLIQTAVAGVATFNDISFNASGNFTLAANSGVLTQDISTNIAIVGADISVFPSGSESMGLTDGAVVSIDNHELNNGFDNISLTMTDGGAANPADIRDTNGSAGYTGASGEANVWFTSTSGDYGFAMEGIDASTYTNLTLQFAVRKQNAMGTDFATLAVDYWDGDSWEAITISDFPANGDGAGWYLLSPVILPAAAEISDLGLRWVKSGTIACRIDDVSLTGTPKAATNLIVATINGGLPPVSGASFNVDINVQDGSGSPANVLEDTDVQLTLDTGTGALGGTLTATVLAGTNTAVISGVTYDALVATDGESGVIITASRTSGDNLIAGNSSAFNVLATEPITSASGISIDARTTNSIDISWTSGNGSNRIVVVKDTTAVDQLPVDGTSYIANPDFELGQDIGDGNIVVFAGAGNSVSITNLQPNNIEYHFAIFEYNSTLGLENYKQANPAIGSAFTACDDPGTQASSLTFSNTTQSSLDLSWTDGNGAGRIVLMNSINSFTDPLDGDDSYVADPNWNDAGEQVVYFASGAGVPVAITNLSPSTTYYFRIYEFNCSGSDINYKIDIDNTTSSQTHLFAQYFTTCPAAGWSDVVITGNQSWQCDAINGYASASGIGSNAASETWYISPAIDFSVLTEEKMTFNSWTGGTDDTHPKLTVMYSADYSGSGNPYVAAWDTLVYNVPDEDSQVWTSSDLIDLSIIPDGTAYIGFRYNSSGTTAGSATEWRIDDIEIFDQSCIAPALQANNLTFSTIAQDSMTVSWTKGDGIGRLIVASPNTPFTFIPGNSNEYPANSDYSTALDLGNGDKVVYSGGSDSFVLTGLTANTTYYFAVYEFSCNGANRTYLAPALTGSQVTLNPNGSDIVITTGYPYNTNIDYTPYDAINALSTGTTIDMVGYTIQDEGFINIANSDGYPTELTSITFSTNGSTSIRAAGIFLLDGTRIAEKLFNGDTTFVLDSFENPLIAPTDGSINFELRVTFEDNVLDNEQIVFTITSATPNPLSSLFAEPDAGGTESINTGGAENNIIVQATQLNIVQGPEYSVPVNELFTMEVEAIDSRDSRDLSKTLSISNIAGTPSSLSSSSGLTISAPLDSTALWVDLIYANEEITDFEITDGEAIPLTVTTGPLFAKPRHTIYTFTGAVGDEATLPPDFEPVNVSVSDISRGPNISTAPLANAFSADSWPTVNSVDLDSYYEFTVTANAGYSVNVSSIEFDHRRSASGPDSWQIRNSTDSYASFLGGSTIGDGTWNTNQDISYTISGQSSVTFRIYAYNASSALGTWAVDNIEIFGTATDTQAPSFTATYPQYDSVAVDGFDLLVKTNEPVTAYYIVQDPATTAPSRAEVEAGQDGTGGTPLASGSIMVTDTANTFIERVRAAGLSTLNDVYFVLNDDTFQSDTTALLADVPIGDTDTDISVSGVTQPLGSTIPSTADNSADSVAVFSFDIIDAGSSDGSPTHVTKLFFVPSGASTVGYDGIINGVRLYNTSESLSIPISNTTIGASSLEIDIPIGGLTIGDGLSEEITLFVWLNDTVPDNETLDFRIGDAGHGCETYTIGSQFDDPLAILTSNPFTIDVDADRLYFDSYPLTVSTGFPFVVTVSAIDLNGNVDSDEGSAITLSRGLGSGLLATVASPAVDPQGTLSSGTFTWSDVTYTSFGSGEFMNIIVSDDVAVMLSDTTDLIEAGSVTDLIVPDGTTITLTSDQTFNTVEVRTGGILNLASGITMTLTGDITVDGTFNDLGGTTSFIGSSRQDILGSQTITFYNLNIANSHAQGVVSRTNVNLINTLKLNAGTTFDADGQGNEDWDFVLISTPTATARIDVIEDGATLSGNVVWQRSLRTGPQGWRYVGTPIQGQTVAEWIDDVYIQGIEGYPNWWRNSNFGTYNEPSGTTGMGGYDGWVDYAQVTDNIDVGVGNKLWEWDQFYVPTLTIINKGLPTIGDGDDDLITGMETISFPVSYTPTSFDGGGWNFYANPYPCELNWNAADFVHTNVGGAVYIWNPEVLNYTTYTSIDSINGGTRWIASGQGFFINAVDGSAVVSVTENAKSTENGNSFLRLADDKLASIKVKITSDNNYIDETAIAFKTSTTDGYDPDYDARKLAGGWVNLSSNLDNGLSLAINAMGSPRGVQNVKLNVDPYYYGNYSLSFSTFEGFETETVVTLVDKYLEKSTVVSGSSIYNFSIDQNDPLSFGADRFELQLLSPLKFSFDDVQAKAGQEFVVPVYADNIADIVSTQLGIGWDVDGLSFVGIEESGYYTMDDFQLGDVEYGRLGIVSSSDAPLDLPDGAKLFSIRFKALNGQPQAQLRFEDASMRIKAFNDIDMPFSTKDLLLEITQNSFISGRVDTYAGDPVMDVTIEAKGDDEVESISDDIGAYSLGTYEQSSYSVSATKVDGLQLSEIVTTLDIIMARRHILNIEELESPYQEIAADVNGSKSISAMDLAEMRSVVLGIDASFQSGLDWLIIPTVYDLSDDPFNFNTVLDISLTDQDVDLNFKGVKVGDVDNSWASLSNGRKSSGSLALGLDHMSLKDEVIEIPVVVQDLKDISGYQFTVRWDSRLLEYAGVEHETVEGHFNDQLIGEGILTTMWDDVQGQSVELKNGATLFILRFNVKDKDADTFIELNSSVTEAVAFDGQLNPLAIASTSANVNLEELRNGKLELFQNVPNPFDFSTSIQFKIPKQGKARLSVVNLLGEIIYLHEQDYRPGVYQVSWSRNQSAQALTPGVYLYRLECNGEEVVKRMIIE